MQHRKISVFIVRPEEEVAASLQQAWRELLSAEECARHDRFMFQRDRSHYLLAHALVRNVLSEHTGLAPSALKFKTNAWNRPELANGPQGLRFNLSHTLGLIALIVSDGSEVGIDVEAFRTVNSGVANKHFATAEIEKLSELSGEAWRDRFFSLWTLKESYIKARGMGLALPLDGFAFDLPTPRCLAPLNEFVQGSQAPGSGRIRFSAGEEVDADPGRWFFQLFDPGSEHRASIAVECPRAQRIEVAMSYRVPLGDETPLSWDTLAATDR